MPLVMIDLDDTLVQRAPLVRTWLTSYVEGLGHDEERAAALVDALVEADGGGHRPREEFVAQASEQVGSVFSLEEFRDGVDGAYRLTPGVRSRLEALRAAGWRLAVVTNGPVETQSVKVEATGLDDLVDAVVISGEVGAHKPDPLPFLTAAERADASLDGAWMVGDNLDADVQGAHGVGAKAIWVRPQGDWLEFAYDGEPDVVVDDVDAALDVLLEGGNR